MKEGLKYLTAMLHKIGLTARRGTQRTRKDKDIMQDTGGATKQKRRREPGLKPSRTDVKKRYREKTLRTDEKDQDIHTHDSDLSKAENKTNSLNKNHKTINPPDCERDNMIHKTYNEK